MMMRIFVCFCCLLLVPYATLQAAAQSPLAGNKRPTLQVIADERDAPGLTAEDDGEAILRTYYAAQGGPAHQYVQKRRIQRFLSEHWTPAALGMENQQWLFDGFAKYVYFDCSGAVISSDDLYCIPFRAAHDRYGFAVVRYWEEGPAIQNRGIVETPYLYDLQQNLAEISSAVGAKDIDLSKTVATRGQMDGDEVIVFADQGGKYVYDLETREMRELAS